MTLKFFDDYANKKEKKNDNVRIDVTIIVNFIYFYLDKYNLIKYIVFDFMTIDSDNYFII